MSTSRFLAVLYQLCCVPNPEHSLPRCSENYIRIVATALIAESLFSCCSKTPRPAASPPSSFRFSISLNALIWVSESFPHAKQSESALWRAWCGVTCDVATSIGTFDQSDQGSLVRVRPLGTSRVTITVYCISYIMQPCSSRLWLPKLSLCAGTKHAGQNPPSSMVSERPTSANVFGIMLRTAI